MMRYQTAPHPDRNGGTEKELNLFTSHVSGERSNDELRSHTLVIT